MGVPCAASCCHKPGTPMSVVHESTRGRLPQAREWLMGRPVEGNEALVTLRKHVRICVYMYIDIGCTMSSRRGRGVVLAKRRPCFACSFYFISLSQSIYAFLLSSFARPDVALLKPQRQTRQKCQASPCPDDAPRALQQAHHHQLATKDLQSSALVQRASQPAVHAA